MNDRISTVSWYCAVGLFAVIVCGSAHAEKLKSRNYKKHGDSMGVVLLDINWGRSWGCGRFENAQLANVKFEMTPLTETLRDKFSSIELKSPSRLFVDPEYLSYGFIVHPGEYALTEVSIKVARSINDVGYLKADKATLVNGETYSGGVLRVGAGEIVYIGHFDLDCLESPILWRYYADGWDSFESYIAKYRGKYKFLRGKKILYRLFDTDSFGHDYALPAR